MLSHFHSKRTAITSLDHNGIMDPGQMVGRKADIQYSAATRSYHVVLQVGTQYLGDVTGYQAQVTELQGTIQEQAGTIQTQQNTIAEKDSTIAQQEETIQTQTATIDSQAAAIEELEAAGTAETVKADLQAAYEEGVESNG